jgi:hypothetical protein
MASHIERRKFLATLLGGAAAWPRANVPHASRRNCHHTPRRTAMRRIFGLFVIVRHMHEIEAEGEAERFVSIAQLQRADDSFSSAASS